MERWFLLRGFGIAQVLVGYSSALVGCSFALVGFLLSSCRIVSFPLAHTMTRRVVSLEGLGWSSGDPSLLSFGLESLCFWLMKQDPLRLGPLRIGVRLLVDSSTPLAYSVVQDQKLVGRYSCLVV